MTQKQLLLTVAIVLFFINLGVSLRFINALGSGSEAAGALIRLGKKFNFVFNAAIFSGIAVGISALLFRQFSMNPYLKGAVLIILSSLSIFLYYQNCLHS